MVELLDDPTSLQLLNLIVSGRGVEVNISELSKKLKKHRKTIKDRVKILFENKVINRPQYPFSWIYSEFPLMVVSRNNFLRDEKTKNFIERDDHVFAAFFFKEEEYNTLMISFHKDVCSHVNWHENIIKSEIITKKENGYYSQVLHLGTDCFEKFNTFAPIHIIGQNLKEKKQSKILGVEIDNLTYEILSNLLHGTGIRTNENFLAKELNIHRKTIERRIDHLLKEGVIGKPVCFFPKLIVPPEYILVKSLVQVKKSEDEVLEFLKNDNHITWIIRAVTGRGGYNLVIFSTFYKIEDHLEWQESLDERFPGCIGAMKDSYLSSKMTFSIDPEFVSLRFIQNKMKKFQM